MIFLQNENAKVFSLKEIAGWTTKDSGVSIPALQRGLVWSPQQTEFLWDSILRTFPIGGFVLSQNADGSFYLMDGQQRYNAIRTGFSELNEDNNIILWIDLKPTIEKKSTRLFFIKATTRNHPWGFKNDDECSVLNASERREALKAFGHEGENIFKTKINLLETFPIKSTFPIPFNFLLNATLDSAEDFADNIIQKINNLSAAWKKHFKWNERETVYDVSNILKTTFYPLIEEISKSHPYVIPCSILSQEAISTETERTNEMDKTNLEILFTRLNKGGTAISQEDLYYSAIKAYWENIKDIIDTLSEDKMPPQYLAMLFFRLALTVRDEKSTKFVGNLSIKQIRQYARDEQTKSYVENFIQNDALRIIDTVYDALSDIPKYLVMKIITRKREIFLLLMYFAYKKFDLNKWHVANLAMYLYWFSTDPTYTVNKLFECFKESEKDIKEQKINEAKQLLSQLVLEGRIINVYKPNELKIDTSSLKRPRTENAIDSFWNIVSDFKHNSFLILAEKDFINSHFPEYNPAHIKGWDKTNCPWDYDHIIPKSWSEYQLKSNPYKAIVDYWLWRIGNFAAIPFEENRSKNNRDDYGFYLKENNAEKLFFDKEITTVTSKLIANEDEARTFVKLTYNRTIRIYESCYNYISTWLPILSSEAEQRKSFFQSIQAELPGFQFFYVFGNKECIITSENDWNQKCLSLAFPVSNDVMVGLTWNIGQYNKTSYEIGYRKNYTQTHLNDLLKEKFMKVNILKDGSPMADWWYLCGIYDKDSITKQKCIELLRELCEYSKDFLLNDTV
ncbi:Protein of unknown function DUF262 [Treponema bryantii]|uniref:GmrSD restriction endonucleases N-terminal domain-containing protein n=1 Tax=Treponema bryantii TaxID=163 RepID=A0A1I3LMH9_9SPIR|nr:DUF262 domain-containing protein [Treponema bryantii]SFI85695.1 Protein of unknown function DUF262 [Treponema bryantii]